MKKKFLLALTLITCMTLMSACSFFLKDDDNHSDETATTVSNDQNTTHTDEDTDSDLETDTTTEDSKTEDTTTEDTTETSTEDTSNPRDNVANDTETEFTATGIYCGFIDSNSVEIEFSDGSFCTFFVYEDEVKLALSNLDEETMPEITFTYKAREGQVNPEMIQVQ